MIVIGVVISFSERDEELEPLSYLPVKAPEDPDDGNTISVPNCNETLRIQFDAAEIVSHSSYSPGNRSWKPTEEDRDEWNRIKEEDRDESDRIKWEQSVLDWAHPRLAKWHCRTCKESFGANSRFIKTEGDSHVFKHKCKCGYDHTVKLKHGN